jgi:hypothetical protein
MNDQPLSKASTYTEQRRNTKTNIHASSGIPTDEPSNNAAKTYTLERAATGTGKTYFYNNSSMNIVV